MLYKQLKINFTHIHIMLDTKILNDFWRDSSKCSNFYTFDINYCLYIWKQIRNILRRYIRRINVEFKHKVFNISFKRIEIICCLNSQYSLLFWQLSYSSQIY